MPRDGDVSGGGGGTLRRKPQTLKADLARLEDMDTAGLGGAGSGATDHRHPSPCPAACSVWRSHTTCRWMSLAG